MQALDEVGSALTGHMSPLPARLLAAYGVCALAVWSICRILAQRHFGHILTVSVKVHILAFAVLALQAMPLHVLPHAIFPRTLLLCTCGLCLHLALTLWVNGHLGCSDCPYAKEGAKEGEEVPLLEERASDPDLEAADEGACDLGDAGSDRSTAVGEGSDAGSESSGDGDGSRSLTPEETVIIFDWDDTVLPSFWVQAQGLRLGNESVVTDWQRGQLAELSALATETLRVAKTLGTVVFVTNADDGWIEQSCEKFMPDLWPALLDVKLLSARTKYETAGNTTRPVEWKALAFEAELRRIFSAEALACHAKRKNVMSIGDSTYERDALMRATRGLPNARSKSVKLVERPDVAQLRMEHSMIVGALEQLAQKDGDLDLWVNCAMSDP